MHTTVNRLARVFAILGGIALSVLIVLTCLSIAGRSLNSVLHSDFFQSVAPSLANALLTMGVGPVNGDFELVEVGMAFTIFSFLPLCQLHSAHASVDIFTSKLPLSVNRILRLVVEVVFAAVLIVIAFKLFSGMESKRGSGQTTLLLQFPVWWGYLASLPGAITTALVSIYIATCRLLELTSGRVVLPHEMESTH